MFYMPLRAPMCHVPLCALTCPYMPLCAPTCPYIPLSTTTCHYYFTILIFTTMSHYVLLCTTMFYYPSLLATKHFYMLLCATINSNLYTSMYFQIINFTIFLEITMAPKDLHYNVPDVLSENEIGIQEDEIEIQYPDPGLSPEEFKQEIDELISLQLNFMGK